MKIERFGQFGGVKIDLDKCSMDTIDNIEGHLMTELERVQSELTLIHDYRAERFGEVAVKNCIEPQGAKIIQFPLPFPGGDVA